MKTFDLLVIFALGLTLAVLLIPHDVTLLEGVAAFAVLLARQLVGTWMAARVAVARRLIKAEL